MAFFLFWVCFIIALILQWFEVSLFGSKPSYLCYDSLFLKGLVRSPTQEKILSIIGDGKPWSSREIISSSGLSSARDRV